MKMAALTGLGLKHVRNHLSEEFYLRTDRDATRPVSFYGIVNEHCNIKCRYCEYWRLKHYKKEMSIEEWQKALLSVKAFVGTFSINFSGGEPFIKPGFLDLMVWCHRNHIHSGVTTNGSALTRKNCEKLAAAQPFNVNISVDAPYAEVHDYLRGCPGLFEKLSNNIQYLLEERDKAGLDFPIIIKPTVNKKNFRYLPDIVEWVKDIGATCVNFQPMDRWTPETYDELWIEKDDLPELQKVADRMLQMKRSGYPILNSALTIALLVLHFQEKKAPPEVLPCRVGMRDFFIKTNGDVEVCFFYPTIGNIREQSAREIWYGPKARDIRKQTVSCDRLCLYTCLSQKTLSDKLKMGLALLKNQKPQGVRPHGETPVQDLV